LKYQAKTEVSYNDLPGGAWLDKFGIFDFWDVNKSEIWQFIKSTYQIDGLYRNGIYIYNSFSES
jgi:hypothetical protein